MTETKESKKAGDFGASEVQQAYDKATKQGFFGIEVDQTPNKEYSLQSGPDSPLAHEAELRIHIDDLKGD